MNADGSAMGVNAGRR